MKEFYKTKVVSAHLIRDWFQSIRNLLGLELKKYSNMIDETLEVLIEQAKDNGEIKWYKFSINELTNGAVMITIYGEYK